MKNRHGKPPLSQEDRFLWEQISDTVTPLRGRSRLASEVNPPDPASNDKPGAERQISGRANAAPPPARGSMTHGHSYPPKPPPLTGVDRRTRQKLMRGRIDVEARIDLHGFRRLDARVRLKDFLSRSAGRDLGWVLVITGKGTSPYTRHTLHGRDYVASPDRTGVLRDAVAGWLAEMDFREMVMGFQPAHPKHGGGGAFYVRLRRRRGPAR